MKPYLPSSNVEYRNDVRSTSARVRIVARLFGGQRVFNMSNWSLDICAMAGVRCVHSEEAA